ncbi:MAG TPA: NAD(P)H-binding protein [Acidimicrobiales bacterium]|nr:NAD(P)H-binding protein [Acidimicrobiales bacterium]
MRIAVAGGTGTVGKYVVLAAERAGHQVAVLSRRTGVDVQTGDGLKAALEGADVVVDAINAESTNRSKASAILEATTRRLQVVGAAQGVARLVTLSIVGIDRVPGFGYYQAKLAQEAAALDGPLPVTILRATQFHEFPAQVLGRMHVGPLALVPHMRVQPIAARTVGEILIEVATAPPGETIVEVAGPEPADLVDLARAVVVRRGQRTAVVPVPVPGQGGKAMRSGALLPTPGVRLAGPRFAEWLAGEDLAAVG